MKTTAAVLLTLSINKLLTNGSNGHEILDAKRDER